VYRGEAPSTLEADTSIAALSGTLDFPLTYGYAAVGHVEECGKEIDDCWRGKRVFSFQPHTSHFVATPDTLIPLPEDPSMEDGVMIPSLETAVNLVMDGQPMIGERVVLFGQGVIGLLTTALLCQHPVTCYTVDPNSHRRTLSEGWGAERSFHPSDDRTALLEVLNLSADASTTGTEDQCEGADLVYELSGYPPALDDAISVTGFDGCVVVGAWYGTKEAHLQLGGRFHRSRIQLKSSQVSTVDPDHQGRWTKERRMSVVKDLLNTLQPGSLISDTFPVGEAPSVYRMIDEGKRNVLQPVFQYS
jgi:threonine dehydrogenase-like Zn-dependent dehydrogenase